MSCHRTRPLIRALLIDVSGNLHIGSAPTPNAVRAFQRLREANIPFRLCSNTSKESTESLILRLKKIGFEVPLDKMELSKTRKVVWTSIGLVKHIMQEKGLNKPFLLLTRSAKEELSATIQQKGSVPTQTPEYDSVVVGLSPASFDYETLNTAFRILMGEHQPELSTNTFDSDDTAARPPLIATHKAKYIQNESPPGLSLGPGPFITALENASGTKAHVVGKPTKVFFQTIIDDFYGSGELERAEKGHIAVIGDDVEADLGEGAVELGLWRILVKTGKYRAGDEKKPGVIPPDEVYDSFADFIDSLILGQI